MVPVPEAYSVEPIRRRLDPSAAAGMPAHVTLLFPFLQEDSIDSRALAQIGKAVQSQAVFEASFASIGSFPDGTLYLEPSPGGPFQELTARLEAEFGIEPYEGRYATVTPHLTVGQGVDAAAAAEVATLLVPLLPIRSLIRVVWLVSNSEVTGWVPRATFELAAVRETPVEPPR